MSVLIDTVRVAGFRGLCNTEITLNRVSILIGANNSGKTSLLKAIALALGDHSGRIVEEDFHIGPDDRKAEQILVDLRIVPTKDCVREPKFSNEWTTEFGDSIKQEADGNQFVAVRVRCVDDPIRGGYTIERSYLDKWPKFKVWKTDKVKRTKATRFENISFLPIEAQRDVHSDLRSKSSYVGRVLSGIEYQNDDIESIENQIKKLNKEAVDKSDVLKGLKRHFENLNCSFDGSGTAEIIPFPRKIRDLSKNVSVHLGEPKAGTFPMEYHGIGTRSWAAMLTVQAFSEMLAEKHRKEFMPFFSVMAAEEPEAHLHPSAQKAIYRQLENAKGQVIVSTHSPYLASIAQINSIRYLNKTEGQVSVKSLTVPKGSDEERRIQREIIHSRGEILFSKAIVLCEGESEEQALPILFFKYFGRDAFELGISFVGVGGSGAKYAPYLRLAKDFAIPFYIFSDGESQVKGGLKKTYEEIFSGQKFEDFNDIVFLDGTNFEGHLVHSDYLQQVEGAIASCDGEDALQDWINKKNGTKRKSRKSDAPPCSRCQQPILEGELRDYDGDEGRKSAALDYIRSQKTRMAPAIANEICRLDKPNWPPKIVELFSKIENGANLT